MLTTLAFCKLTCQTPPNHDHPHLPSPVSTHPMGGPNYRPTLSLEVVVRMIPTTLSDALRKMRFAWWSYGRRSCDVNFYKAWLIQVTFIPNQNLYHSLSVRPRSAYLSRHFLKRLQDVPSSLRDAANDVSSHSHRPSTSSQGRRRKNPPYTIANK